MATSAELKTKWLGDAQVVTDKISIDADLNMNSFKLTNLAPPTTPNDAARMADVVSGKTFKEALLVDEQLLGGSSGGILQAILIYIATNPIHGNGHTFIITDD